MTCRICARSDARDISDALSRGESVRVCAARVGESKTAIGRHRQHTLNPDGTAAPPAPAPEVVPTSDQDGDRDVHTIAGRLGIIERELGTRAERAWQRLPKKKRSTLREYLGLMELRLRSISLMIRAERDLGQGGDGISAGVAAALEERLERLRATAERAVAKTARAEAGGR